jgi:CBS domain-containing protein
VNSLLPLTVAVFIAHGFTVLTLRRSILTEKVSRRGFHLSREYAVDPLEVLFAREVMRTEVVALPADMPLSELTEAVSLNAERGGLRQGLYPVVDDQQRLVGVVTRTDLRGVAAGQRSNGHRGTLATIAKMHPIVAYPDEPLRVVIERMAETGLTRLPVVARNNPSHLVGLISLSDFLRARQRNLEEERTRERVLTLRFPRGGRRVQSAATTRREPVGAGAETVSS